MRTALVVLVWCGCARGAARDDREATRVTGPAKGSPGAQPDAAAASGALDGAVGAVDGAAAALDGAAGVLDGAAEQPAQAADAAATDAGSDLGPPDDAGLPPCQVGRTRCDGACVDLARSAAHCGACFEACGAGFVCDGVGGCVAPAGCSALSYAGHDYLLCSAGRTWSDARASCLGYGMDLAVIDSAEENIQLQKANEQWIGYSDRDEEGIFRAVVPGVPNLTEGARAGFELWDVEEPNNSGEEDCVEQFVSGGWNDENCGEQNPFVCESY